MQKSILGVFGIAAVVLGIGAARADVVLDWNDVALDVIRAQPENPPRATRALAMMHTAVFEAVNGIKRNYEPYLIRHRAPRLSSPVAAAAVAAHKILAELYPAQIAVLDAALAESLAAVPDGLARTKGAAWGRYCAVRILWHRRGDGSSDTVEYAPSGEFGAWQPTPPAFAPALLPQWPYVTPFAMTRGDQFRVAGPPAFESEDYADAFNEVKSLGEVDSAERTDEQTLIAYFWEDGAGTVTPPGHWQVIAHQLSEEFGLSLAENARLFALLSIAQADAAIASWDIKYAYDHLRPVTAITLEADDDDNPETEADPTWLPLLPTPPFPAYTSGHSTFSGASARILALFFGTDDIAFSMASPDPNRWPEVLPGVVRSWDSLSQAAEEAGQSRIYGGIHWGYDNSFGLSCGRSLADFVFTRFLQEVRCEEVDGS